MPLFVPTTAISGTASGLALSPLGTVSVLAAMGVNTASMANNGFTKLTFPTSTLDTDSALSTGVFTCPPAKGGIYLVSAGIVAVATTWPLTAQMTLHVGLNGANASQGLGNWIGWNAAATVAALSMGETHLRLNPGDTLQINVFHNQGGTLATSPGLDSLNFLRITRVPGS